jgi:hypothetical protein
MWRILALLLLALWLSAVLLIKTVGAIVHLLLLLAVVFLLMGVIRGRRRP